MGKAHFQVKGDSSRSDKIEAISKVIEAEITSAWVRKSSLEVRAFSLISANVAVVTIFFALQSNLGYTAFRQNGLVRLLVIAGLVLMVISVVAALISAFPRNYPVMESGGYGQYLKEASDDEDVDLVFEFVEFRISQLEAASASNSSKSWFVLLAFSTIGVAILVLTIALVAASLTS